MVRSSASPHTRGWTRLESGRVSDDLGFPAHAGMDRDDASQRPRTARLPRTRGDGPAHYCGVCVDSLASPHTRGWTRLAAGRDQARVGFPAHAGMDPSPSTRQTAPPRLPRTRGDGPSQGFSSANPTMASPHTRGWTFLELAGGDLLGGFPAHAGMDRAPRACTRPWRRLPRTRGDGPHRPASWHKLRSASPHTRGWTRGEERMQHQRCGFPAHAGMDPRACEVSTSATWLPRTRGDGPLADDVHNVIVLASPHTRGWTQGVQRPHVLVAGFPAHAGMDPTRAPSSPGCGGLPRTRGDGPSIVASTPPATAASPHTRGWTPGMGAARVRCGLPRTPRDGPRADTGTGPGLGFPHTGEDVQQGNGAK